MAKSPTSAHPSSANPELFESAETIPNTIVKVEASSKEALGQVTVGPAYQFNSNETGGKWFLSLTKRPALQHIKLSCRSP